MRRFLSAILNAPTKEEKRLGSLLKEERFGHAASLQEYADFKEEAYYEQQRLLSKITALQEKLDRTQTELENRRATVYDLKRIIKIMEEKRKEKLKDADHE